jgi:hypothetical protein
VTVVTKPVVMMPGAMHNGRCQCLTLNGEQCRRRPTHPGGNYCAQHLAQLKRYERQQRGSE